MRKKELLYPIKENCKWGYINSGGKIVIKPTLVGYPSVFGEEVAYINVGGYEKEESFIGGKWGLINRRGKIIIEPRFDTIGSFEKGAAPVRVAGKYGYITKKGKYIIKPIFNSWPHFQDGVAWVNIGGKKGIPRFQKGWRKKRTCTIKAEYGALLINSFVLS